MLWNAVDGSAPRYPDGPNLGRGAGGGALPLRLAVILLADVPPGPPDVPAVGGPALASPPPAGVYLTTP